MSSGKSGTDKPPRIKGLVKRCRSFKEDIISRIARNKSLTKEDLSCGVGNNGNNSGGTILTRAGRAGRKMPGCSSEGTSPTPATTGSNTPSGSSPKQLPQISILHRLKEAYLTLQFVESLIRKDCIDLIGGSSNVMLDLVGTLLSDVRKTSASDSPSYQSVMSQIKMVLSEFLVSVDILLLKNRFDEPHRQLSYEKLMDSLKNLRIALDRLKSILNGKENENKGGINGGATSSSSSSLLLSSSSPNNNIIKSLKSPNSTSRLDSINFDTNHVHSNNQDDENKKMIRPPLPPKLHQWGAGKSFDTAGLEYIDNRTLNNSANHIFTCLQPPSASSSSSQRSLILNEWLEKTERERNYFSSQPQFCNSNPPINMDHQPPVLPPKKKKGFAENQFPNILNEYNFPSNLGTSTTRLRTMSDSFYNSNCTVGSDESLERLFHETNIATIKMPLPSSTSINTSSSSKLFVNSNEDDILSQPASTGTKSHCSQSLSLGNSLENLLLVDSTSTQEGLSPNSINTGRRGTTTSNSSRTCLSSTSPLHGVINNDNDPYGDGEVFTTTSTERLEVELPPKLPTKTTNQFLSMKNNGERCHSPYDNVINNENEEEKEDEDVFVQNWNGLSMSETKYSRQFMSYSESRSTLVSGIMNNNNNGRIDTTPDENERPPLPPKKKHSITAYVELFHHFDNFSQSSSHISAHGFNNSKLVSSTYQHWRNYNQKSRILPPPQISNNTNMNSSNTNYSHPHFSSFSSTNTFNAPISASDDEELQDESITGEGLGGYQPIPNNSSSFDSCQTSSSSIQQNQTPPPALPPKKKSLINNKGIPNPVNELKISNSNKNEDASSCGPTFPTASRPITQPISSPTHSLPLSIISRQDSPTSSKINEDLDNPDLYLLDASSRLIKNENIGNITHNSGRLQNAEGPEIKGGEPVILMVYAASPDLTDIKFREVFLLTYRTFVRPVDLIGLLWKRFEHFEKKLDRIAMIHRRATLELFVDVICSLTPMDLDDDTTLKVRNCIYHLVNVGEIHSALKSRKEILDKFDARLKLLSPKPTPASLAVTTESHSLLNWSSTNIAQQMTLLDAELFRKLEPGELLLWAREQQEDFCPALNNFTDHFNKVSYWARSKVLLCASSRERNRTMKKMIEVMRKLRDYSNFNSLLAVLAALDSAPIRRLGFSKRLTEALKPHAALTDSSGSFRTYRQALAESKTPCIPYIGLVLQDLTFVHIGNADCLPDGKVNWLKRWQQWVVLEPIRRFHSCHYGFMRNDVLLSFLNNFDDSLNDDDLWQMSESIKPRGKS